jgi:hypothetical protein
VACLDSLVQKNQKSLVQKKGLWAHQRQGETTGGLFDSEKLE